MVDMTEHPPRPKSLILGIILIIASLCFGIAHMLLVQNTATEPLEPWLLASAIGFSTVLTALFLWGIALGMRWVLVLYVILFALTVVLYALQPGQMTVASIVQLLLELIAILLFFSKSTREWFAKRKALRHDILR